MKIIITKLFKLGLIIAFLASSCPVSYAAQASSTGFFEPCQYKQSYRYYLEKGDAHMADDQLQAALQAYKKALMIQPISKEAKEKIVYINQLLAGEKPLPKTAPVINISQAQNRRRSINNALDNFEEKRERRPLAERKRPSKTPDSNLSSQPQKSEIASPLSRGSLSVPRNDAGNNTGNFYHNYLDLVGFSNGIDQSIQEGIGNVNSGIAPGKITGEYQIALGFTSDDVIWKDANADHVGVPGEKNWRYIWGENQYNMYDKKIYSRLKVEAEGPITAHTKGYSEIVIDPWTFVGKKDIEVKAAGNDAAHLTLKYWSNARRCLNETYRSDKGDIVNIAENKVIDGKTTAETYSGLTDWGSVGFSVPETDINNMYVPIRKMWVDYDNGPYHARVFPMASQDEALTSDDPMHLSNNKVAWEESSWLDEYEPSRQFKRTGAPIKGGQWIRSLSFVAKNSDYERLTFLRGVTATANYDNGVVIESTFAAPRSLWDYYEEVSSIPGAVRIKLPTAQDSNIGLLYTTKMGLSGGSTEALNQVVGVDAEYLYSPNTNVYGECAFSFTNIEEVSSYERDYWGAGYKLGLKNKGDLAQYGDDYKLDISFAHMNNNFYPGLSSYRFTRQDSNLAKHIYFQDLKPENEEEKIGNGIDIDRIAVNANLKANFLSGDLKTSMDWRDVRSDSGSFIEDVTRAEAEYKLTSKLTTKALARYKYLPKTKAGIDPLINAKTSYIAFTDYFSDKDVWLENNTVEEGKNPSIGTYSLGLKYDALENLSLQGIYEITNDPLDMPRGLLNNVYVTEETRDGILWDKLVPFVYNQSTFGAPPYKYYDIFKTRLTYYPIDQLKAELSYVYNDNKFATTLDDNVNHAGINLEYTPNDKCTLSLAYYYTRVRELWMDAVGGEGINVRGHHNVFLAADYDINANQSFTLMFGEYAGYGREYYEEYTSIGPLDTQHIIRLIYKGTF